MKKIALFTSGGDSPGMNACIRAVVRSAIQQNWEVLGIDNGYAGIIEGSMKPLVRSSVSNIIQRGGTILKTSRSEQFKTKEGMKKANQNLCKEGVEGVIAIGGDGTFTGALEFTGLYDIPFIGIPGTIDNDLFGTDFTIGYDTAINTVVSCVDKIRETADSHNRVFIIEVMGRDAGFIALRSGIAVGAEAVLIPEETTDIGGVKTMLEYGAKQGKRSNIIIVAEGDDGGGAIELANRLGEMQNDYEIKVSILGHVQRGGAPSCMDRVLASRLGVAAVQALAHGKKNIMVGTNHRDICHTPFSKAIKHHKEVNKHLLEIIEVLTL